MQYQGGKSRIWNNVQEIAKMFDVEVVPVVMTGTIEVAVFYMKQHPYSNFGSAHMEGLVGRLKVDLYDRNGNRALVKVKRNDIKELG